MMHGKTQFVLSARAKIIKDGGLLQTLRARYTQRSKML